MSKKLVLLIPIIFVALSCSTKKTNTTTENTKPVAETVQLDTSTTAPQTIDSVYVGKFESFGDMTGDMEYNSIFVTDSTGNKSEFLYEKKKVNIDSSLIGLEVKITWYEKTFETEDESNSFRMIKKFQKE